MFGIDVSISVSVILCSLSHLSDDIVRWHHNVILLTFIFGVLDDDVTLEQPIQLGEIL